MTATRDETAAGYPARSDAGERSAIPGIPGLRWWATLLLGLVLTAVGVGVDLLRGGQLRIVYDVCFPTGCGLAVVWARRRELFGPMVQPPLLLAVTVPDRKSTRLNSSHSGESRMPSSA